MIISLKNKKVLSQNLKPIVPKQYNYGCPSGRNGKYCDPCGNTYESIIAEIVGGVPAKPYSYPAQVSSRFLIINEINSIKTYYLCL